MSTNTNDLFISLLRPAVLHILRATGFHSAKPSVVDTLVDLTARYLSLLASHTAANAHANHNDLIPDITDVREAMQDCGLLLPTLTASEEIWREMLRKPIEEYDEESGARAKEQKIRDSEDTADVLEFIDWVKSEQNREIMRIGGTLKQPRNPTEQLDVVEMEDYLSTLMKKHSKTGVESRFQGTVLGHYADPKPIKIEGGPVDTIEEWCRETREKTTKAAESTRETRRQSNHVPQPSESSEDTVMATD